MHGSVPHSPPMDAHALEYVRVRTAAGTLQTNMPLVEAAVARWDADGYRLVSTVPDTHNGDLVGILLLFAAATA
jgi:hypothetical protein